jgi:hypothetical protein
MWGLQVGVAAADLLCPSDLRLPRSRHSMPGRKPVRASQRRRASNAA